MSHDGYGGTKKEGEDAKLASRAAAACKRARRRLIACASKMHGWQCARRDEQHCRAYDAVGSGPRCVAQPYEMCQRALQAHLIALNWSITVQCFYASPAYKHTSTPVHFYCTLPFSKARRRRVAMGVSSAFADGWPDAAVEIASPPPLLAQARDQRPWQAARNCCYAARGTIYVAIQHNTHL